MEMERSHSDLLCQLLQARDVVGLLNQLTYARHPGSLLFGRRGSVRTAPFTGTKAGPFRIGTALIKADVLPFGQARMARRPAVNTGCLDRIIKLSIGAPVALRDEFPILLTPRESGGRYFCGIRMRLHFQAIAS